MEDAEIVNILHISLVEAQRGSMFLCQKVQSIQCLCLGFSYRRNIGRPRLGEKPCKVSPGILDEDTLGSRCGGWLVIKKRAEREGSLRVVEP